MFIWLFFFFFERHGVFSPVGELVCLSQQHCAWRLEQLDAPSVFAECVAAFMNPGPTWLINPLAKVFSQRRCPHGTIAWERGKQTPSPISGKKYNICLCEDGSRFGWLRDFELTKPFPILISLSFPYIPWKSAMIPFLTFFFCFCFF